MQSLMIFLILFLAVFTQSLTGFGSALIAMALLPTIIGLQIAVPLVAVLALTLEVLLLMRYRKGFEIQDVWQLALAAIVGIPLGVLALRRVDEGVVLAVLGLAITGYGLYSLFELKIPRLEKSVWAYGFGFLSGILGGAYNVSGPPVVIYGHARGWEVDRFKGNLQGYFVISSAFIALNHLFSGNLTMDVWRLTPIALIAIGIGVVAGTGLDRWLNPIWFRKAVLALLLIMGVRMFLVGIGVLS